MQIRRKQTPKGLTWWCCDRGVTWQQMEPGDVITWGHSVALRLLMCNFCLTLERWLCMPPTLLCVFSSSRVPTWSVLRDVLMKWKRHWVLPTNPGARPRSITDLLCDPGQVIPSCWFDYKQMFPYKQMRLRYSWLPKSLLVLRIWDSRGVKSFLPYEVKNFILANGFFFVF